MSMVELQPVHIWVEDEMSFGPGDGSSKEGTAWTVDPDGDRKGSTEVGRVQRTDVRTSEDRASVTLVIHLTGDEFGPGTLIAKGALPYDAERDDIGSGLLAITGGTGAHAGKRGVVEVTSWNPKKYREIG